MENVCAGWGAQLLRKTPLQAVLITYMGNVFLSPGPLSRLWLGIQGKDRGFQCLLVPQGGLRWAGGGTAAPSLGGGVAW